MQAQRLTGVAARSGLITGLFVGILSLPFMTLMLRAGAVGLGLLFIIIALIAFAIAGYIATRRSGLLRSGVGAGALAAAIALFIAICLGVVIVALLAPGPLGGGPFGGGFGRRGGPNLGVRALRPLRIAYFTLFLSSLLVIGAGVLGGFLGGLLGRLGRPRPSAAPQFAPGGPAPQFTPPTAAPFAPAAPTYPSAPSSVTPPPYYPPAPPYDPNAPTNPSGPRGE